MENKQTSKTISLSDKAIKECYINIRSQLIKLLYMIENEQKGEGSAELWFYGFMYELISANELCKENLVRVVIKIHGLYKDSKYKTMTHSQTKKQIMECKGIVDHLIKEIVL